VSPAERNTRTKGMGINGGGRVATESCPRSTVIKLMRCSHAEGNDMSELTKTLQVLLTPEEHEELERLADSRGLSAPTVAREAILRLVRAEAAPGSAEDRRLVQDWQIYP
jgi:hypothetical protein